MNEFTLMFRPLPVLATFTREGYKQEFKRVQEQLNALFVKQNQIDFEISLSIIDKGEFCDEEAPRYQRHSSFFSYKTYARSRYERRERADRKGRSKNGHRLNVYDPVSIAQEIADHDGNRGYREVTNRHNKTHWFHNTPRVCGKPDLTKKESLENETNLARIEEIDKERDWLEEYYYEKNWDTRMGDCQDPYCKYCGHLGGDMYDEQDKPPFVCGIGNSLYDVGISHVEFFGLSADGEDTIESLKNIKFAIAFVRSLGGNILFTQNPT